MRYDLLACRDSSHNRAAPGRAHRLEHRAIRRRGTIGQAATIMRSAQGVPSARDMPPARTRRDDQPRCGADGRRRPVRQAAGARGLRATRLARQLRPPLGCLAATAMAASQQRMGDAWLPAYLELPVWRFVLPGGMCGAGAVLGVLMPSVDRVGRYYPLTLAAVFPSGGGAPQSDIAEPWLEACETAGRAALDEDATPDQVVNLLPRLDAGGTMEMPRCGVWWTAGGPRVAAMRLVLAALPDAAEFAAMLGGVGHGARHGGRCEAGRRAGRRLGRRTGRGIGRGTGCGTGRGTGCGTGRGVGRRAGRGAGEGAPAQEEA